MILMNKLQLFGIGDPWRRLRHYGMNDKNYLEIQFQMLSSSKKLALKTRQIVVALSISLINFIPFFIQVGTYVEYVSTKDFNRKIT